MKGERFGGPAAFAEGAPHVPPFVSYDDTPGSTGPPVGGATWDTITGTWDAQTATWDTV